MRKRPYGANFLALDDTPELIDAFREKILFRYTTERKSSGDILEGMVREKFNVAHALATTSGTQSLRLALLATRPNVGDKVYIPATTFVATADAVLSCGLIPVLVDCNDNFAIDVTKIPSDAKRVIVVHLDGVISELPQNVPWVIEDTAQSIGALHENGSFAGTKGSIGIFSFNHSKILASGQGGMVTTNDETLYDLMRKYHDHGVTRRHGEYPSWPTGSFYGENLMANEMQTSVQIQQFRLLDFIKEGLARGYDIYREELANNKAFSIMERKPGDLKLNVRLRFETPDLRDKALKAAEAVRLPTWTYDRYFLPDHPVLKEKLSIYADGFPWNLVPEPQKLWNDTQFECTRKALSRTLCLPLCPENDIATQRADAKRYKAALTI